MSELTNDVTEEVVMRELTSNEVEVANGGVAIPLVPPYTICPPPQPPLSFDI